MGYFTDRIDELKKLIDKETDRRKLKKLNNELNCLRCCFGKIYYEKKGWKIN